jgi:hypothetical protein
MDEVRDDPPAHYRSMEFKKEVVHVPQTILVAEIELSDIDVENALRAFVRTYYDIRARDAVDFHSSGIPKNAVFKMTVTRDA